MKLLSIECSAGPASAALWADGKVLASFYVNVKLTHSQTLMPMIKEMLAAAKTDISEIDGIAIASGPGSFTGVRIGISAAKGLAMPRNLPTAGVSTLYAMAHNLVGADCLVCAVMDARCRQVYHAMFDVSGEKVTRLSEDSAVLCEEAAKNVKKLSQNGKKHVIIVGDGADIFAPYVKDMPGVKIAEEKNRYQNAVSVALAAAPLMLAGKTASAKELLPNYLRLPQAERELHARRAKGEVV